MKFFLLIIYLSFQLLLCENLFAKLLGQPPSGKPPQGQVRPQRINKGRNFRKSNSAKNDIKQTEDLTVKDKDVNAPKTDDSVPQKKIEDPVLKNKNDAVKDFIDNDNDGISDNVEHFEKAKKIEAEDSKLKKDNSKKRSFWQKLFSIFQ